MWIVFVALCFVLICGVDRADADCTSTQTPQVRQCFSQNFNYNRNQDWNNYKTRYMANNMSITDTEHSQMCNNLATLANCLAMNNLTGCVTGPVFTSILATNFTGGYYNGTVAKSLNCFTNALSIWKYVQCEMVETNDVACSFNTTSPDCATVNNVLKCQVPKAKQMCGLLASEYICTDSSSMYRSCDVNSYCSAISANLTTVTNEKQMLYAAAGTYKYHIFLVVFVALMAFLNLQ